MAKVQVIGKNLIRIACDCKKYVHEISKSDSGKIESDTFMVNEPEAETPAKPKPEEKPKKGKKRFPTLFDDEEEEEEETEDEKEED